MNGLRVAWRMSRWRGGRKEERDIKRQAAGLIAFKAVRMMYGAAGAPANTHQHVQTTKIVKNEGGECGGGNSGGGGGGGGVKHFPKKFFSFFYRLCHH